MIVAPLKIIRERPQVARISRRSFSVDTGVQENIVSDSDLTTTDVDSAAGEDSDCSFLFLAEQARQEYIKRRASVTGCKDHQYRAAAAEQRKLSTQLTTTVTQPNLPLTSGIFKHVIVQHADRLHRNKAAVADDELVLGDFHKKAFSAANGGHTTLANSVSNEYHLLHESVDNRTSQNQHNSNRLENFCDSEHTAIPTSVAVSGRDFFSSEYKVSEIEPDIIELVVLPPPPDFAECNGRNRTDSELISSSASSVPEVSVDDLPLDAVLPPPPPEFSDSPSHIGLDFGCRPVAAWSVTDVTQWLESLQMGSYCDMFRAHSINGPRLVELGRSELINLGVSQVGQRMNLERAIKRAVMAVPGCL